MDAPRIPTKIELLKWLFLIRRETRLASDPSFYEFVPYEYGPFSFTVYRDIEGFEQAGLVWIGERHVRLRDEPAAKEAAAGLPGPVREAVQLVLERYGHLGQGALVQSVYSRYPWFASKSKLRRSTKTGCAATPAVYTAGYEGESIDLFFQKLLKAGIKRIVDVRNNPVSRKYGFSKGALQRLTGKLGIDYVHVPELGIPSSARKSLATRDDYEALFGVYEATILRRTTEAQGRVAKLLKEAASALLCFESDPSLCHRGRLAAALTRIAGMPTVHLE